MPISALGHGHVDCLNGLSRSDLVQWHFSNVPPMWSAGPVSEVVRTKYARSEFSVLDPQQTLGRLAPAPNMTALRASNRALKPCPQLWGDAEKNYERRRNVSPRDSEYVTLCAGFRPPG